MTLPEAEERKTWEHPTFRLNDKIFLTINEEDNAATVKASPEEQSTLIGSDPDTFSVASHVGRFGWVKIDLDEVDPQQMEDLVENAWRCIAPKRLLDTSGQ